VLVIGWLPVKGFPPTGEAVDGFPLRENSPNGEFQCFVENGGIVTTGSYLCSSVQWVRGFLL